MTFKIYIFKRKGITSWPIKLQINASLAEHVFRSALSKQLAKVIRFTKSILRNVLIVALVQQFARLKRSKHNKNLLFNKKGIAAIAIPFLFLNTRLFKARLPLQKPTPTVHSLSVKYGQRFYAF